jgi:hypothetical protein
MTRPELPREMAVPDIVIAEPPVVRVVPAMLTPVGFAEKVWPPSVKILVGTVLGKIWKLADGGGWVGRRTMEVPIASPLEP